MSIYKYEEAFGAWDRTGRTMRRAIEEWFSLYYRDVQSAKEDSCQRIAYSVVNKITRSVFGEYNAWSEEPFVARFLRELDDCRKEAMQLALVGGECYIKPCPQGNGFVFSLIPRSSVLIFGRDSRGMPTDMGMVERSVRDKYYYTLLERRRVDEHGYLTIENKLYRSLTQDVLGSKVNLSVHPQYAALAEEYRYEIPIGSVGLVRMKTPMINCVDGSQDGVSAFAAAVGLIRNIDRNEAQMNGEFRRGQSRIIASADLLRRNEQGQRELEDHLFVGLDEDPEQVGITIFSPQLREASFLARKQEYLRNVESIVGLKRGMLSNADMEERTATEITASSGDYTLTVLDFKQIWEDALKKTGALCCLLAKVYRMEGAPEESGIHVDWGNGVLYDQDKTWADYMQMVKEGMLKPEVALGWRFNMAFDSPRQRQAIREKYMPQEG